MTRCLIILFFCSALLNLQSVAQTKSIFHKSHSGSAASFFIALEDERFGMETSDFGMAPDAYVKNAVLDSLIFLSDSVTVMVTSEHCGRRRSGKTTRWSAGKDTLINHPDFTRKKSVREIKKQLSRYYFNNSPDSVKFIDVIEEDETEYQVLPIAVNKDNNDQGPGNLVWLGLLSFLALSSAFILYFIKNTLARKLPVRPS